MPKTYNDVYIRLWHRLRDAGIEAHALEARLIVAAAAGKTQAQLLRDMQLYCADTLPEQVEALAARRLAGEPAAYITGSWGFYGLDLKITPDVLIPRSDTETLVTEALARLGARGAGARILDLCTGSGCVGCALATRLPRSRVVLADFAPAALAVAGENVTRLSLDGRAEVLPADALAPPPNGLGSFDLIVSNPPYVPTGEWDRLDRSVRDYEPRAALDGGPDGLDFYRAIARHWRPLLRQSGSLLFEVGEDQAEAVKHILRGAGLRGLGSARDTQGIERVVYGRQ